MPLSRALARHAATRPAQPALCRDDGALSYGDLWRGIGARHGALCALPRQKRSISAHQPLVALCLGNHAQAPEWLALALAAPVTLALLDPRWPAALRAETLQRLAPDIVITAENADFGLGSAAPPPPETTPEMPLFIGFTSGTTARPKAFERDRTSWGLSLAQGHAVFALDALSHTLAPGPLVHGLTFYALAETLHAGATFTGMGHFTAPAAFERLANGGITRLVAVPTMLEGLTREALSRGQTLPTTQITTAGAKLPATTLARLPGAFPHARVSEYYGASELGFVSLAHHTPDGRGTFKSEARGVGRAYPDVRISIRDNGKWLPAGEVGTVFVESPHPISGYLFAEGPHSFINDGTVASVGDLGTLDAAGNLTLLGRADGMVISGGYNVYPEEVAEVLAKAPGVSGAEVFGLPDDYLGQRLVAILKLFGEAPDLTAFCTSHLPRYKVPRAFFAVEDWPLTQSGKIARGTLKNWIESSDIRLKPL
jgi:long-chain acyl-CoA synthetase